GLCLARARSPSAVRTKLASQLGQLGASPPLRRLAAPRQPNRVQVSPSPGRFLRTGRSPPAALHPVSRRRSCNRLQFTLTWRGLPRLRSSALSGARSAGILPALVEMNAHHQFGMGTVGHHPRVMVERGIKPVLRGYKEFAHVPENRLIQVYWLEEIATEKTVALVDRARNEPRDIYDLWHLTSNQRIQLDHL